MSHIKAISKEQKPAQAASLLEWQQKAVVLGGLATGLSTLATAFNTWTQAQERKGDDGAE